MEPINDPTEPNSTPGEMRSVGTTSGDGQGLTILLTVTDEELIFSGSIQRSHFRDLLKEHPERVVQKEIFFDAVRVLLDAAHRGGCDINCKLGLTINIHGIPIQLETKVRRLETGDHNELCDSHSRSLTRCTWK